MDGPDGHHRSPILRVEFAQPPQRKEFEAGVREQPFVQEPCRAKDDEETEGEESKDDFRNTRVVRMKEQAIFKEFHE